MKAPQPTASPRTQYHTPLASLPARQNHNSILFMLLLRSIQATSWQVMICCSMQPAAVEQAVLKDPPLAQVKVWKHCCASSSLPVQMSAAMGEMRLAMQCTSCVPSGVCAVQQQLMHTMLARFMCAAEAVWSPKAPETDSGAAAVVLSMLCHGSWQRHTDLCLCHKCILIPLPVPAIRALLSPDGQDV